MSTATMSPPEVDRLLAYWRSHADAPPWVPTADQDAEMRATLERCLQQAWGVIPRDPPPDPESPAWQAVAAFAESLPL